MSFVYTPAKTKIAKGLLNLQEAGVDLRAKLCMSNTTADTDQDAASLSAIGTLDEYNGSGYTEATLAAQTVNEDAANNRAELSVTSPISFGSTVGAGTRQAVGALLYVRVDGTAANDWPVAWIDTGGFPIDGGGGPFEIAVNAEGLLQVA